LFWRTGMIGGGGLDDEGVPGRPCAPSSSNPLASTHARSALRTSDASVPFDLADNRLI
jgi:hypothetical protein